MKLHEKTDTVKYYYKIPRLMIPKSIKYEQAHKAINTFIDTIPSLVEALENNFASINKPGRQEYFVKNMDMLVSLLRNVYARGLETEAMRVIDCVNDHHRLPVAGKIVKPFIMEVLSLSIAMQEAQILESMNEEKTISKAETLADIVINVSAVGILINSGEFEKALNMVVEFTEINPDEHTYSDLLGYVTDEKYDDAKLMINLLKEKLNDTISQSAGTDLSKKILAVDDMPEILTSIKIALNSHYKVFGVTNGKAALKLLDVHNPDLFILDIDMPEMDGFELAEVIRSTVDFAEIPLIFLTGNASRERIVKAMGVGCNDFIVKPANHEVLLTKVGKYLSI